MSTDSSRQAGAHQLGEIEITEEMIYAGREAFRAALPEVEETLTHAASAKLVTEIFLAMLRHWKRSA